MSNSSQPDSSRISARIAAQSRAATAFDFDVVTDAPKLRSRPPEPGAAANAAPREKPDESGAPARS
jgi:hypothetical protein